MKKIAVYIVIFLLFSISGCSSVLMDSPTSTTPTALFDEVWHDFDQRYALFDVHNVNWDSLYQIYRPRITDQTPDSLLAKTIDTMLEYLHDRHVSFYAYTNDWNLSFTQGQSYLDSAVDFNFTKVSSFYLRNTAQLTGYGQIAYGFIHDSIGYIYLRTFDEDSHTYRWANYFGAVLDSLHLAKALIIDVRSNDGGTQQNFTSITSHFFSKPTNVMHSQLRNGTSHTDFSAPEPTMITPTGNTFSKPIILISNRFTVSAGEWFTLAMKTLPNVTHIGDTTSGAFSGRLDRELANGWLYSMSIEKVTDVNGISYEGKGIPPDYTIHLPPQYIPSFSKDTTLDKAVELLSK